MQLLRREIHPAITIPARAEAASAGPVIDFTSSDETLDRYREILTASGWRLENYRRNPVVQNAHNYGDILFTIGRALVTEVRGRELFQRIEFATEVNPVARIAYGLYQGGFLNAVSVGFYPIRWEEGGPNSAFERKYVEQELVEVSAVALPANPNALQMALQSGAVERHDLDELIAHLELLCSSHLTPNNYELTTIFSQQADPGAVSRAPGPGADGAHWEQLAQLLNETRALVGRV